MNLIRICRAGVMVALVGMLSTVVLAQIQEGRQQRDGDRRLRRSRVRRFLPRRIR